MAKIEFNLDGDEDAKTYVTIDTNETPKSMITIWQKVTGQDSKYVELSEGDLVAIQRAFDALTNLNKLREAA